MTAVQDRFGLTGHEPGGRPLVLCFGYLHCDKGIEDLIEAVACTARTAASSRPAASTSSSPARVRPRTGAFRWFERHDHEYERAAPAPSKTSGLEDHVRFVGFVASADVPALFAAARVVVVPYTKVTQSSVLGTATVAGDPVVATDLPGLRGPVGDGGLLVPPGDPDALATALAPHPHATTRSRRRCASTRSASALRPSSTSSRPQLVDVYHEVLVAPPRSQDRGPVGAR